jgi:hypothetical protein
VRLIVTKDMNVDKVCAGMLEGANLLEKIISGNGTWF